MPIPAESDRALPRSLLRDDAYLALRTGIIDGTFAPGERLNDAELGRWLGVSRTPIREAIGRLERAGLVQSKPGSYTRVSPLDVREARAAQSVAAALHELAVREAVPSLTASDLRAMREANQRFTEALNARNAEAALGADDDFHAVTVTASANPVTVTVLEQVTPLLRRLERIRFSSLDGRGSVALHEQIITLCEAGDADAAGRAARENWQALLPLVDLVDAAADSQAG
ncbi:GntR family transcriptional regulator [Janibacter sp. G56]|uniref:GntR family transcriptional regulator n=1 Tax=Janibacter sp. G56 TaxID=3418717 RepID=UPI003D02EAAB